MYDRGPSVLKDCFLCVERDDLVEVLIFSLIGLKSSSFSLAKQYEDVSPLGDSLLKSVELK